MLSKQNKRNTLANNSNKKKFSPLKHKLKKNKKVSSLITRCIQNDYTIHHSTTGLHLLIFDINAGHFELEQLLGLMTRFFMANPGSSMGYHRTFEILSEE